MRWDIETKEIIEKEILEGIEKILLNYGSIIQNNLNIYIREEDYEFVVEFGLEGTLATVYMEHTKEEILKRKNVEIQNLERVITEYENMVKKAQDENIDGLVESQWLENIERLRKAIDKDNLRKSIEEEKVNNINHWNKIIEEKRVQINKIKGEENEK